MSPDDQNNQASEPIPSESITICHRPTLSTDTESSMRTFVQFDSPQASEDECSVDDDGSVSPLSAKTPPSSGTRWIRFFPELSSHFSLTSPTTPNAKQFEPFPSTAAEPEIKTDSPDSSSTSMDLKPHEMIDDASSCYSRKTSVTSANSEYTGRFDHWKHRSADAFSILSPVAAGVFDDTSSIRRFPSTPRSKASSNKPLPDTPPILLAPLAVCRNPSPSSHTSEGVFSASSDPSLQSQPANSPRRGRTFTQAADELEDVLAGFTTQDGPTEKGLQLLNGPLQISRGNMDMIATRPAPAPPVDPRQKTSKSLARVLNRQPVDKSENITEPKSQKKPAKPAKHKGPFSFSVPGFGRKHGQSRMHLRSFSSSNMRSEMESHPRAEPESGPEMGDLTETENKDDMEILSGSNCPRRPSSLGSERELQRPAHHQTKKMQPVSQISHLAPSSSNERIVGEDQNSVPLRSSPSEDKVDTSTDKTFASSTKLRRSNTFVLPYQLGSLQAPEVIYELEARPSFRPRETGAFPAAPDRMIFAIMDHSNSLDDLFSFAIINKNFYRVFKNNELQLIKNALFDMSPAAWELRQMSPPWDSEWQILDDPDAQVPEYTPTLYLRRYAQDIFILAQLKSLILARCATFLRHDTIRGLAGLDSVRAAEVDEAFWRIWTFCRIFGCGKNREDKVEPQIDWLNGGSMAMSDSSEATAVAVPFSMNNDLFEPPSGFGRGNAGGLSQNQLYDMTEIWTCLSVLLQPIHGKCAEAREAGIFDGFEMEEGDNTQEEETLEEWTAYILTLGLSAVLCLSSISPSDTTATTFQRVQSLGLTKWERSESEASRSSFLKEAVSKVYKLRESESASPQSKRLSDCSIHLPEQSIPQLNVPQSTPNTNTNTNTTTNITSTPNPPDHRQRQAAFAAELRSQRNNLRNRISSSFATERPISNYTVIMDQLDGAASSSSETHPLPKQSNNKNPIRNLARINTSNRSGVQTPPPQLIAGPPHPPPPQVLDPADRAIRTIVQELGFEEGDAKWALKITDTGEGIDVDSAVDLLYKERKSRKKNTANRGGLKPGSLAWSVMNSRESRGSGWRWH